MSATYGINGTLCAFKNYSLRIHESDTFSSVVIELAIYILYIYIKRERCLDEKWHAFSTSLKDPVERRNEKALMVRQQLSVLVLLAQNKPPVLGFASDV